MAASLLDQLEDRAAELESENANLRRRVVEVEGEASEMVESLAAARTANRDLMSMVNR
jgi:hypothetical protein